jgi:hypothetical protein
MKEDEMGGAGSMHMKYEKVIQNFSQEIWNGNLYRHKWMDNIKMDVTGSGCKDKDWILLA